MYKKLLTLIFSIVFVIQPVHTEQTTMHVKYGRCAVRPISIFSSPRQIDERARRREELLVKSKEQDTSKDVISGASFKTTVQSLSNIKQIEIKVKSFESEINRIRDIRTEIYSKSDRQPIDEKRYRQNRKLYERAYIINQKLLKLRSDILRDNENNRYASLLERIGRLLICTTQVYKTSPFNPSIDCPIAVVPFEYLNRFKSIEEKAEISRHQIAMHMFPYLPDGISLSEAENPANSKQKWHSHPQDECVMMLSDGARVVFNTGSDVEKNLPIQFGQLVYIPSELGHRIENISNVPSADCCLKAPLLQLVKYSAQKDNYNIGNRKIEVKDPPVRKDYNWGAYFEHVFENLPTKLLVSDKGIPIFVKDGYGRTIPLQISPLTVKLCFVVLKEKEKSSFYQFSPIYKQCQMLRVFPWSYPIPDNWNLDEQTEITNGEISIFDETNREIDRRTINNGDVIILDNSALHGKNICSFRIENRSARSKMIIAFMEPVVDEDCLSLQAICDIPVEMVVFDMDGTLVEGKQAVSDEILKNIHLLLQQGIKVAVLSAKSIAKIEKTLRVGNIQESLRSNFYEGSTGDGIIKTPGNKDCVLSCGKIMDDSAKRAILSKIALLPCLKKLKKVSDNALVGEQEYSILVRENSIVIGHLDWLSDVEKEKICDSLDTLLIELGLKECKVVKSAGTVAITVMSKRDLLDGLLDYTNISSNHTFVCGDSLNGHGNDRDMLTAPGINPFYCGSADIEVHFSDTGERILKLPVTGFAGSNWLMDNLNRIVWLDAGEIVENSLVGGKGLGLMKLAAIDGVEIPKGFVVTTVSYRQYVRHNYLYNDIDLLDEISEKLINLMIEKEKDSDIHLDIDAEIKRLESDLEKVRSTIENKILTGEMPYAVKTSIQNAYAQLQSYVGENGLIVACRSSATIEDMKDKSAAGQHRTVLGLSNIDETIDGVLKVWASLFSPEAVSYRNKARQVFLKESHVPKAEEVKHTQAKMAVVVERLIQARSAGIAFNVDVRKKRKGVLIEGVHGFGGLVVNGTVTPDYWLYDREGNVLLERQIIAKDKEMIYANDGKMREIDVDVIEQNIPSLREEEAAHIAQLVNMISKHCADIADYIDLEFAVDKTGKLYFLQLRPVTTEIESTIDPLCRGVDYNSVNERDFNRLYVDGEVACLGSAAGRIIIINQPDSKEPEFDNQELAYQYVEKDDILVTPTTNIGWTRLFEKLGGIVTERGGVMSHTSIIARENDLSAIVGSWGICEKIKNFFADRCKKLTDDGSVIIIEGITLDAINGLIADKELPLIKDKLSQFILQLRKKSTDDYYSKRSEVAHYEDNKGIEWTGKPEYELSNLQFGLYEKAWFKARDRIGMDKLSLPITTGIVTPYTTHSGKAEIGIITPYSDKVTQPGQYKVLAVPTSILCQVGDKMRDKGFKWNMEFQQDREKAFRDFTNAIETLNFTNLNLGAVFDLYSKMICYAHLRAGFRRRVVGPLLVEATNKLPLEGKDKDFISLLLTSYLSGLFTETSHLRDVEYQNLLFAVAASEAKDIILSKEAGDTLRLLQNKYPEVYSLIWDYAFRYKLERGQNDNLQNPLPLHKLVTLIKEDIKNGKSNTVINKLFYRTQEGYKILLRQLRPFILERNPQFDFEEFEKIMVLARSIPAQVDMERNLQHRCQNKLRAILFEVGEILKDQCLLAKSEDVFDFRPDEICRLVEQNRETIIEQAVARNSAKKVKEVNSPIDFYGCFDGKPFSKAHNSRNIFSEILRWKVEGRITDSEHMTLLQALLSWDTDISRAASQQVLVEYLRNNPEVFEELLKIMNDNIETLTDEDKAFLGILEKVYNKELQKVVKVIPSESADIYISVDEKKTGRTRFDHTSKKFYVDGKEWQGDNIFAENFMHIDEHIKAVSQKIHGRDYIVIPYGNLLFNSHFVLFKDGKIYHRDGEFDTDGNAIEGRSYTCFIVWKDGRKTIERLIFKKDINSEKDSIYLASYPDREITENINCAIYGQQIVKDGAAQDIARLTEEFDDKNQIADGARYSHSLLGLTNDGRVIIAALAGDRKEGVGVTVEEAARFLIENEAESCVLLSNGGDVNLRYNDSLITESPAGRDRVRQNYSAIIAIEVPKKGDNIALKSANIVRNCL